MRGVRSSRSGTSKGLQAIPGVGPSIEEDLHALGIRDVGDLEGCDPEALYARSCALQGVTISGGPGRTPPTRRSIGSATRVERHDLRERSAPRGGR
jgi:hypothetical protein